MGVERVTAYYIYCDEPGCEMGTKAYEDDLESLVREAEQCGFVHVPENVHAKRGKWFCAEHTPKKEVGEE